jgi:hypothetical protein
LLNAGLTAPVSGFRSIHLHIIQWFEGEIRQAARVLFDYVAACMSDEETNTVIEQWQHHRKAIVAKLFTTSQATSALSSAFC